MASSELPEEILFEIFSRLPPKSVGKFKCLSKTWRNLLSTPEFLESHFTRKPHQKNLILITRSGSIATINDTVYRILNLPIRNCRFAGSCGGLVLLTDSGFGFDKFLVNPVTLEHVELPESPFDLTRAFEYSTSGFGYDRLSSDYKVVTLSHYLTLDLDCYCTDADVYSVKQGVWITRVCPYNQLAFSHDHGAFVDGALHWIAFLDQPSNPSMIAAFKLADMVFGEMPLPSGLNGQHCRLVVLGGCLCVIDNHKNIGTDIWIMKEYDVPDSWTKLCVVDHDWERVTPLCYIGDEGIVLLTDEGNLVVYTLKETELWDLLFDDVPVMCKDAGAFVESLVSPAPAAAAAGRRV